MKNKSLAVIIPVYNEYENLRNINQVYISLSNSKINFQIIVVESGSTDNSKIYLNKFTNKKKISILFQKKKEGWGSAVKYALKNVTKNYFVLFPIDNQYNINEIISHFTKSQISVVTYRKFLNISKFRMFQSFIFKIICKFIYGLDFKDINSLKIIDYNKLIFKKKEINNFSDDWLIDLEFLIKIKKKKIKFVEKKLNVRERNIGESKVTKFDILKIIMKLIYFKFFSKI